MAKDGLQRFKNACCRQESGCQGSPARCARLIMDRAITLPYLVLLEIAS
jgi:hypothetical protein